MKKAVLFVFMLLMAGVIAAQDETGFNVLETTTWTCPEGFAGQTLNVYNWSTYIGETTIRDFEALCGVTVNYDVYDNNEALIARLRQGNPGYDVAFPTDYAVAILARDGLLVELDHDLIPNFANIAEGWTGLDFDPENTYSMPYLLGSLGVAYNTSKFPDGITSWEQVWNHNGPVAWIEDSRAMMGIALNLLGYDPNSQNPAEIAEARDFLLERSGNVVTIAADDGQTLLERGEVDIAIEYNGDLFQLITDCECEDFSYVVPEEGGVADIGMMVIPRGAQNVALAHVFIDYILDPVVNAAIVNYTLYPTPNQAAIDSGLIPEEFLTNPAIAINEETLANMWFVEEVGEAEQAYNDAWDELKIFAGQ